MLHGLRLLRLVSRIRIALVSRIGLAFDVGIRTGLGSRLGSGLAIALALVIGCRRNGIALGRVTGSRRFLGTRVLYDCLLGRRFVRREAHVERQLL
jgi:hypothetical protein